MIPMGLLYHMFSFHSDDEDCSEHKISNASANAFDAEVGCYFTVGDPKESHYLIPGTSRCLRLAAVPVRESSTGGEPPLPAYVSFGQGHQPRKEWR